MRPDMTRWVRSILAAFGLGAAAAAPTGDAKIVADVESASQWMAAALGSSGYRADFSLESLKRFKDGPEEGIYVYGISVTQ